MNRATRFLALGATAIVTLTAAPQVASAWGSNGHRITARIAEDNLTPVAAEKVRALAGKESLALLATWPDHIRSYPKWDCVKPWHFLTVEDGEKYEDAVDQPADNSRGDCDADRFVRLGMPDNVVEAIEYFAAVAGGDEKKGKAFGKLLSDSGVKPYRGSVPLTALILVVHFVGDVHQPLHVGRGDDRGGNSITVEWFGELTPLHTVWDSGLIEKEGLSYTEFAAFLEQEFADRGPVDYGDGPATWAQESVAHRKAVYDIVNPRNPAANLSKLSYNYAADNSALLRERLYLGGMRLAQLLNSVFDPGAPANAAVGPDTAPDESLVQNVEPEIICRTVKRTGSNIREKECFTREQEAQMSAESREFLRTHGARGEAYRPPDPHDPRNDK